MAEGRIYNFSAGPSVMPLEVLETVKDDLVNWQKSGMSVMEMSHRGKEFVSIYNDAVKNLRDVLDIPEEYKVVFVQGGATLQFASLPLNMLGQSTAKADYLVTGQWSEKAAKECNKYGIGNIACNTKDTKFTSIKKSDFKFDAEAKYVHYCDNETVNGVEYGFTPEVGSVPLVADMSSNFCSRPINVRKHAAIYAGVQKNLGPAGMAVNILRDDVCKGENELKICPTYCSWKTAADNDSMYNTPACFTIYVMGEYLKYTKKAGGISYWTELSDKKSSMIYDIIDGSDGFYKCPVDKDCRSRMNLPFTINGDDEPLTKKFLEEAKKVQMVALAGHRSVGGCRASLYNGMPMSGVESLGDFMKSFKDENRK